MEPLLAQLQSLPKRLLALPLATKALLLAAIVVGVGVVAAAQITAATGRWEYVFTQLDANRAKLFERLAVNPALATNGQFLPLYFASWDQMRQMIDLFERAGGNPSASNDQNTRAYIAILANVFRVVTLVLGAYYLGVDTIEGLFHDLTGIALFVFALALFFFLDRVLIAVEYVIRKTLASWGAQAAV